VGVKETLNLLDPSILDVPQWALFGYARPRQTAAQALL
jgi:hypothetical protein